MDKLKDIIPCECFYWARVGGDHTVHHPRCKKFKDESYLARIANEIQIWESRRKMEESPLGGNVVKAAQYGGTAAGLKIAMDMFTESMGEEDAKT